MADKPTINNPWWFRLLMFLAYMGPFSVLVITSMAVRTAERYSAIEIAGKKGLVLFIIQVALFIIVSLSIENPYWRIETGSFTGVGVALALCCVLSVIYGGAAIFGMNLHFPEPVETWAINLHI